MRRRAAARKPGSGRRRGRRDSWRQEEEDQPQGPEDPNRQEGDLHRAVFHRSAAKRPADRRGVQAYSLQHRQREEEAALTPGQPCAEAAPTIRCFAAEGDGPALDVGVFAELVGAGMVPAVLVHPPAVADADQQTGDNAPLHSFQRADRKIWR
jgi:hypothetical protein